MAFPRKYLYETEEIVLDLHPHVWFFARQTAALVAAIIVGLVVLTIVDIGVIQLLAGLLILVALAWWGWRYAEWATKHFVITTDRVIWREGVFTKEGIEIPLERINNVLSRKNPFERIVGSGDLIIESAGESGRSEFSDVRKPDAVQNEIFRQMESNENRKFDRVAQGVGATRPSVADELDKLNELRERGVLSEDEFRAQKAKLLGP